LEESDRIVARPTQRDTTTDGHRNLSARGRDRRVDEGFVHRSGDAQCLIVGTHSGEQQAELVLAHASDDVDRSCETRQPARQRSHDRRARENVVRLDRVARAVDRHEHERANLTVASRRCERDSHLLVECRPLQQSCDLVDIGTALPSAMFTGTSPFHAPVRSSCGRTTS
jgi:hypothetical protein